MDMRLGIRRFRFLPVFVAVVALSACGGADDTDTTSTSNEVPEPTTAPTTPIAGTTWVLTEASTPDGTVAAPAEPEAYVSFDAAGTVLGNTGCNGFSGTAHVADDSLTFEPLISTKVACSGDVGLIDAAMLQVLDGEVSATVVENQLTIERGGDHTLTFLATAASPQPS